MKAITIEQFAEQLGKTVWSKGDFKRIYMNNLGYNTKDMSTKTFIYQGKDGIFYVSCKINCPAQHDNWIDSQEKEIMNYVQKKINEAIEEIENSTVQHNILIEYPVETAEKNQFDTDTAEPVKIENLQLSEKVFIGTGKAIHDNGLFTHIQPDDTQIMLWLKWHWCVPDKKENFAPMVELFLEKAENTHKLKDYPYYFHLNNNPDGTTPFESFIAKFIAIEKL